MHDLASRYCFCGGYILCDSVHHVLFLKHYSPCFWGRVSYWPVARLAGQRVPSNLINVMVSDPFSPHSILYFYILLKEALHTDFWCHWMESLLNAIKAVWTQGQQQSDSHGGFQVANRHVPYTTWIFCTEGWPHPRHDTAGRYILSGYSEEYSNETPRKYLFLEFSIY